MYIYMYIICLFLYSICIVSDVGGGGRKLRCAKERFRSTCEKQDDVPFQTDDLF